jgi:hypothetical protein
MAYSYKPGAAEAATPANLLPIEAPPVNRYTHPWGTDVAGVTISGNQSRHIPTAQIQFIPIKFSSTITIDRIGLFYTGANSCVDTWTYNLGIYSNNSTDNYPDARIASFGSAVIVPGTTPTGSIEVTISQVLNANTVYWLAVGITTSGSTDTGLGRTPWLVQLQGDSSIFRKRGIASGASGTMGYAWTHSLGSYAGTLPASVTYASNSSTIPTGLRIAVRRSA